MTETPLTPLPSFEDNVRLVMASRHGRAMMWEILRRAGLLQNAWILAGSSKEDVPFILGNQNFANNIFAVIDRACPAHWDLMRSEAREDEDHEQRRAEQQRQQHGDSYDTSDD